MYSKLWEMGPHLHCGGFRNREGPNSEVPLYREPSEESLKTRLLTSFVHDILSCSSN